MQLVVSRRRASIQHLRVEGELFDQRASRVEPTLNFTGKFLEVIRRSLGTNAAGEEIFCYIYAVLHAHTYRNRYQGFLDIDFPSIPLPPRYRVFKELSDLGKHLVGLHLLKAAALEEPEIAFPEAGPNTVDKVSYQERDQRVYINHEQWFDGILKEVWEYRIGTRQVMEKYLKDRRNRKVSLDEITHYMKAGKAIRLTIELQEKIDAIYRESVI